MSRRTYRVTDHLLTADRTLISPSRSDFSLETARIYNGRARELNGKSETDEVGEYGHGAPYAS